MATQHTYFLSQRDQCFGTHASVEPVAARLRALWGELSGRRAASEAARAAEPRAEGVAEAVAEVLPSEVDDDEGSKTRVKPVDGVSVWVDLAGETQVRFIWQGVAEGVDDAAVRRDLRVLIDEAEGAARGVRHE